MNPKLCFASNNTHKLREVRNILDPLFQIVSLYDIGCQEELPETTGTIPGNSLQKAEYIHQKFNVDCFADDSGLEVFALNNAPGVDSATYAGPQRSHEDNIQLLLRNLEAIDQREAQFITVITLIHRERRSQFEGVLRGKIIREKRGSGGFGYDPVFVPEGFGITLAEMTLPEKNKISHRAQALGKLADFLKSRS
ncbi:MAG TPA: RdgB/HAM1 family non-canonical purine NTP pyrophosphatase [Cyclobacteriaceae bacterium]|nr:RdgB/HAM1 family non-canonical purine NTP pyrophosphatase [Cyclobacteriaceae bacterium]